MANQNTIADLSVTPASNLNVLGQSQQGTAPASTIDNIFQRYGAILARAYADMGGTGTVGGTANAITLATASTYQALTNGLLVAFKATADNSAATTINVDSLGAKAIRTQGDIALAGGEIKNKGTYLLRYDTAYNTSGAWVLINAGGGSAATTSAQGIVELATDAEAQAMSDTGRTLTPSNMAALVAAQSDQETATSNARFVSPGRQQFHPSAAKFWAYVTVSAGTPTLAASYNVTSITDGGVGLLTVTINTDFSSANYTSVATVEATGAANGWAQFGPAASPKSAGALNAQALNSVGPAVFDPTSWNVSGFGDQ